MGLHKLRLHSYQMVLVPPSSRHLSSPLPMGNYLLLRQRAILLHLALINRSTNRNSKELLKNLAAPMVYKSKWMVIQVMLPKTKERHLRNRNRKAKGQVRTPTVQMKITNWPPDIRWRGLILDQVAAQLQLTISLDRVSWNVAISRQLILGRLQF